MTAVAECRLRTDDRVILVAIASGEPGGVVIVEWVVVGVVGFLLLLLVWPTAKSARRLLTTWRVRDPSAEQIGEALGYLRRRRVWYPWFFLATPVVFGWFGSANGGYSQVLITGLAGLLIAELLALWPVRTSLRAERPPRRPFDLIPRWAVGLYAFLVLVTGAFAVAAHLGRRWTWRHPDDLVFPVSSHGPMPWIIALATAGCLLAVVGVCRLVVIRPAGGDGVVDTVLRTRSARVALGLGIALQGQLLATVAGQIAFYGADPVTGLDWVPAAAWAGSVFAWVWVANPPLQLSLLTGRNRRA
jgi:hypothetical protein